MSIPSITPVAPAEVVRELLGEACVRRAFRLFESEAGRIDAEHEAICRIPAPPFGEAERAEHLRAKFVECGLSGVGIDEAGNCVALRRGLSERPLLVVSAHLDTVFPAGTDFSVRHDGTRMRAPGIADDGCGLAALVALARALNECGIETEGSLLFVAVISLITRRG